MTSKILMKMSLMRNKLTKLTLTITLMGDKKGINVMTFSNQIAIYKMSNGFHHFAVTERLHKTSRLKIII